MGSLPDENEMYRAVADRDCSYAGVFVVAVRTTRIFCRPGCSARTPLRKSVEFFRTPAEALYAGYRPCLRCRPMDGAHHAPEWVRRAFALVENDPQARLRAEDIRMAGFSPESLRRYFKRHYGMTFQGYARGRRLGHAFRQVREGQDIMETAMDNGFESTSGFREAFHAAFGHAPTAMDSAPLLMRWIDTPLGAMVAAAEDETSPSGKGALVLLEYADRRMMETQLKTLAKRLQRPMIPGASPVLQKLEEELAAYFDGRLREFTVPLRFPGTPFQTAVWQRLLEIPYGRVLSYSELARDLGSPNAQRAVGKANGENRIAILIPCHRVVKADGTLCGYGGGLWRKQRLLELEAGQAALV